MDPDDPIDPLDERDAPELTPIYAGERIEAEILRSLLEANGLPAVVFGTGHYEIEGAPGTQRVMVRQSDVRRALEVLASADLEFGAADDFPDEADEYADDYDEDATNVADVDVLASGSDWTLRIVGILGIAALAIAIAVLITQAD